MVPTAEKDPTTTKRVVEHKRELKERKAEVLATTGCALREVSGLSNTKFAARFLA